ncbi:50S ribosomal protein L6 [Metallosphaera sp. J1]|uniref:50S ribosomal protein L6 n=1 Tax=Metallosphaera javensis (ex Hofmann et al. 2022) TaxID=99938 RepID=UPI001EE11D11|nr:50S ribosomal protein L6 [Metallosphaera javensis (ex Hofmann et al. 2022)]MCG3107760.1 50S ribosomal protein L6 [Metallosphaera javensis (ex Hofmann et al. 2022)]
MQMVSFREEIQVPAGVTVSIDGKVVKVKGKKGELSRDFSFARFLDISLQDGKIVLEASFLGRKEKATAYSIVRHIKNMFTGVQNGYRYYLKIIFTHFPTTVKVVNDEVQVTNLIGEKNVRVAKIMPGVKVTVKGEDIVVEGIDLEKVSQTAANIETVTKIRDFDRRIFSDGIYIYKKEVIS